MTELRIVLNIKLSEQPHSYKERHVDAKSVFWVSLEIPTESEICEDHAQRIE